MCEGYGRHTGPELNGCAARSRQGSVARVSKQRAHSVGSAAAAAVTRVLSSTISSTMCAASAKTAAVTMPARWCERKFACYMWEGSQRHLRKARQPQFRHRPTQRHTGPEFGHTMRHGSNLEAGWVHSEIQCHVHDERHTPERQRGAPSFGWEHGREPRSPDGSKRNTRGAACELRAPFTDWRTQPIHQYVLTGLRSRRWRRSSCFRRDRHPEDYRGDNRREKQIVLGDGGDCDRQRQGRSVHRHADMHGDRPGRATTIQLGVRIGVRIGAGRATAG